MTDGFHPWRGLASLPDVQVVVEDLGELWGYYDDETGTIHIDSRLTQVERRCTLVHETVHAERGDVVGLTDWHDDKQERVVNRTAARRLISIEALADALAWATNEWEVADALWVDVDTVRTRIYNLNEDECRLVEERIALREASA